MRTVRTFSRLALVVGALAALVTSADTLPGLGNTVPPRVIVIMDTSRSMSELPNSGNAALATMPPGDGTVGAQGADFDCPTNAGTCTTKFCSAKETLCTVLPEFLRPPRNVQIGVGGYYQYILNLETPSTQSAQCVYDVLEPAGLPRSFTSTTDYTGSYTTVPSTAANVDISADLGGGGVCVSNTGTRYTVTKTAASVGAFTPVPTSCYLTNSARVSSSFSFPFYTAPFTLTGGTIPVNCSTASPPNPYELVSNRYVVNNITYTQPFNPGVCGAVVSGAAAGNPTGSASRSITSVTTCSGTGTNCFRATGPGTAPAPYTTGVAISTNRCRGYGCDLYLTREVSNGGRAWYGFFNPATLPQPLSTFPSTTSPTYTYGDRSTPGNLGTYTQNGGTLTGGTTCTVGAYAFGTTVGTAQRVNDGTNLTAFGFNNARTNASANATIGLTAAPTPTDGGFRVDETPTATGNSVLCTAGWPCDVTLAAVGGVLVNPTTWYSRDTSCSATCDQSHVGTCVWNGSGTSGPYTTTLGAAPSCGGAFSSTSNSIAAPQGSWVTNANGFSNAGGAPPTDCSTANDLHCSFSAGTAVNLTTTCATVTNWNGVDAGTCAANGNQFSVGTTLNTTPTYTYYGTPSTTIDCAGTVGTNLTLGSAPAGWTMNTACTSYPCVVNLTGGSTSLATTYTSNTTSTPAGVGWTINPVPGLDPAGTTKLLGPSGVTTGCTATGSGGTARYNTTSCNEQAYMSCDPVGTITRLPATSYDVQSAGPTRVTTSGCGTEGTSACYMCAYNPVRYAWTRNQFTCNFSATRTTLTPRTVPGCSYTRTTYTKNDCVEACTYGVTARRYDFSFPAATDCQYSAVQERTATLQHTYSYDYTTKGGELYGTYLQNIPSSSICDGSQVYRNTGTLHDACPPTIPACMPASSGSFTCKLRNSTAGTWSPPGSIAPLTYTYRYGNIASSTYFGTTTPWSASGLSGTYWSSPQANDNPARVECMAGEASLATADDAGVLNAKQAAFCNNLGNPASQDHKLVADWYDPSVTTHLTDIQTSINVANGTSGTIVRWSKPTPDEPKVWGLSLNLDGGAVMASQIFAGIDALSYDATSQETKIKNALRACNLPRIGHGNITAGSTTWDTSSTGFCMSDEADRDTHNTAWTSSTDYTPLYGSLKNAGDYIQTLLANDSNWQCRGYYLLLATDGREDTPAGISAASSTSLLRSYRTLSAGGHRTDLQTFVVGFGTGAAAASSTLDDMAAAGGTGVAYTVTSQAALQDTLRNIFASLIAGTFSRSKPTIATDGSRLYTSYFTILGTDEWAGELQAYKLNVDGSYTWQWSASPKVNAQSDASRILKVATSATSMRDFSTVGSSVGSPSLASLISGGAGYPGGLPANTVIDFLRNGTNDQLFSSGTKRRLNRMGALVHSNPVVVATSPYDSSWGASSSGFTDFVTATRARGPRVLTGSNDGFLRAFVENSGNADCGSHDTDAGSAPDGINDDGYPTCPNGSEAWGFMPVDVIPNLYQLRDGFTGVEAVDGLVSVSDVCSHGGGAANCVATDWKTIAIGSERHGGRGLFALDVTSAADAGIGPAPGYLWGFTHADLGFTYSSPAIGRIRDSSGDRFVAVFGGGKDDPSTPLNTEGTSIFVVDALDGGLVAKYDGYTRGAAAVTSFGTSDQKYARPATHRFPGLPHLFSAFVPSVSGSIYGLRFMNSDNSLRSSTSDWVPEEFWNPTSTRSQTNVSGATAAITQVVLDPTADAGQGQPGWMLVSPLAANDGGYPYGSDTFPFTAAQARPLLNRPRAAAVTDSTGRLPDLFFGTGDATDPGSPGATDALLTSLGSWNYFAAVHDTNNPSPGQGAGRLMWAHYFINSPEQVVSEPAVISGGVIVATYTPASTVSAVDGGYNCATVGDTTLYCFDPLSGALANCLIYMSGPYAGRNTAVVHMGSVGIPSDLLVVNNNMYFATSTGGLTRQTIRQTPPAGDVRSYRRLR